jgi:hypothetical protein
MQFSAAISVNSTNRAACRQHMAGRRSLKELREYLMPAITLPPRKSRVYLPSK